MATVTLTLLLVLAIVIVAAQTNGSCSTDFDCNLQGICLNSVCNCDLYYASANCQYRRKSRSGAFTMSVVFGTLGVDRFYLGYIGVGVVKLLLGLITCTAGCLTGVIASLACTRRPVVKLEVALAPWVVWLF